MTTIITQCRICHNTKLVPLLDLGVQAFTGIFPASPTEHVPSGPLQLVKCDESVEGACGLVQLRHSFDADAMYGDNYGYRSGLNQSMVRHLEGIVRKIQSVVKLQPGDAVLDIGSNDGTMLGFYPKDLNIIGMDPTSKKFREHYPPHVTVISDFFSKARLIPVLGNRRLKAVTSIAMFYDLEDPLSLMQEVHSVLANDGVWVLEQSYMPTMVEMLAYDTICHEHLEYYALRQIHWMAERVGFKILDVEFNDTNGGSFLVVLAKQESTLPEHRVKVSRILIQERSKGYHTLQPYQEFAEKVQHHRLELQGYIATLKNTGKQIVGYGASTKGNVILQYCGFTGKDIAHIGEVNSYKFGRCTPGSHIPILSEVQAKQAKPSHLLVMPWHFKNFIVEKEQAYLASGGTLVFPLPTLTAVSKDGEKVITSF